MKLLPTKMLFHTYKQYTFFEVNLWLLVWTPALLILFSTVLGSGKSELSCQKLKAVLESRKYSDEIPLEPVSDSHLKKCTKESNTTCCLEEMEIFFLGESRKEYNRAVWAAINQLSSVIKTRAKRFDKIEKETLQTAQVDCCHSSRGSYYLASSSSVTVLKLLFLMFDNAVIFFAPWCVMTFIIFYYLNFCVICKVASKKRTGENESIQSNLSRLWHLIYGFSSDQLQIYLSVLYLYPAGFFKNLLSESKRDFDRMFKKTYGIIYEQNAYVFTDFFEELERYYVKGQVDLEEAMENFFNTLYQKMFTVLNAQYQFDDKYLICIGDHMKELKPFGDVPQKLSVQIKRSFVATRTFAQALNVAKDILDYMKDVGAAGDCHKALLRMSYCQACKGMPEVKPCNNLCLNVLKGCLAYHMDLDTEWNYFVDAMDKVSDRLLGPFNIEVVVEPINIKISEAIMNFQENAHEVSEKVFSGCGRLHLGRRTRRETREIELETYEFAKEDIKYQKPQQPPTLEKLIRDIRQKVRDSKSFWWNLPYQICNDEKVAVTSRETPCWNGTAVGRYTKKVTSSGFSDQHNNPEVKVNTTRPTSILIQQLYNLKIVTNKLKNAYNGFDVDWLDIEESLASDVGSGEGSGRGKPEFDGSGTGPMIFDGAEVGSDDEDYVERTVRPTPKRPVSSNKESNVIPKNADDLLIREDTNVYSGGTSTLWSRMNLFKAVISYVFPICIMWLGGSIYEWL